MKKVSNVNASRIVVTILFNNQKRLEMCIAVEDHIYLIKSTLLFLRMYLYQTALIHIFCVDLLLYSH